MQFAQPAGRTPTDASTGTKSCSGEEIGSGAAFPKKLTSYS